MHVEVINSNSIHTLYRLYPVSPCSSVVCCYNSITRESIPIILWNIKKLDQCQGWPTHVHWVRLHRFPVVPQLCHVVIWNSVSEVQYPWAVFSSAITFPISKCLFIFLVIIFLSVYPEYHELAGKTIAGIVLLPSYRRHKETRHR